MVSKFEIFTLKEGKIAPWIKVDLFVWVLQTSLLCIVGELAWGGSAVVAVGWH